MLALVAVPRDAVVTAAPDEISVGHGSCHPEMGHRRSGSRAGAARRRRRHGGGADVRRPPANERGHGILPELLTGPPQVIKTKLEERLAHLGGAARLIPGAEAFLKRAAVLHADAAFEREIDDLKYAEPAVRLQPGRDISPLLSQRSLYLNQDGEILGDTLADWNWPFARSLLDAARPSGLPTIRLSAPGITRRGVHVAAGSLRRSVAAPGAVRRWYCPMTRASCSIARVTRRSRGCPRSQVLLSDADVLALRAQRSGRSSLMRHADALQAHSFS